MGAVLASKFTFAFYYFTVESCFDTRLDVYGRKRYTIQSIGFIGIHKLDIILDAAVFVVYSFYHNTLLVPVS